MNKKIGIIINPDYLVSIWQYEVISRLKNSNIIFFIAKEKYLKHRKTKKVNFLKHCLYNMISLSKVKVKIELSKFKEFNVKEIYYTRNKGRHEELLPDSINNILDEEPFLIYKCGMGLLSIPEKLNETPILSHEFGDPAKFRGSSPGFYEILENEKKIGHYVKINSNEIYSEIILAYGESKVYPWSYKKTLKELFKISPIIFSKAIYNLERNKSIDKTFKGEIYNFPSNYICLYFLYKQSIKLIYRIIYGMFFYKAWNVSYAKLFKNKEITTSPINIINYLKEPFTNFVSLPIKKNYLFYADPFILDSNIVLEALDKKNAKGELLLIDINKNSVLENINFKNKHLSYPYTFYSKGQAYIYPDSGSLDKAIVFIRQKNLKHTSYVMKAFEKGLTDPSVIEKDSIYYLFANKPGETNLLRLWVASNPLFDDSYEHPESPICIGPAGARMGGRILTIGEKIFRFGQDFSDDYGNGLILFEINKLTKSDYSETKIGYLRFKYPIKGPHNIDFTSELITWDHYEERFSIFSGLKRIVAKF